MNKSANVVMQDRFIPMDRAQVRLFLRKSSRASAKGLIRYPKQREPRFGGNYDEMNPGVAGRGGLSYREAKGGDVEPALSVF